MTVLIVVVVVILSLGLSALEKAISSRGVLSGHLLAFRKFHVREADVLCVHPVVLTRRDFDDGLKFPYTFICLHRSSVDGGFEFRYRLPFWLSSIATGVFGFSIWNAEPGELTKAMIGIPFCLLVVVVIWIFSTPSIESVRQVLISKGVLRPESGALGADV